MTLKEFFSLKANKMLWLNLLGMIAAIAGIVWGVLHGIDVYTRHGEAIVVPDVKGLSLDEARQTFERTNLVAVVADSTYVKEKPAGCILDYHPAAGQKVKEGRTIYLTMNTLNVPLQTVPDVADNSSLREAEANLLGAEFKLTPIQYIPGEKDWVYGVKYQGKELAIGEKVPRGATLTLVVGDGHGEISPTDSVDTDGNLVLDADGKRIQRTGTLPDKTETDTDETGAANESWF